MQGPSNRQRSHNPIKAYVRFNRLNNSLIRHQRRRTIRLSLASQAMSTRHRTSNHTSSTTLKRQHISRTNIYIFNVRPLNRPRSPSRATCILTRRRRLKIIIRNIIRDLIRHNHRYCKFARNLPPSAHTAVTTLIRPNPRIQHEHKQASHQKLSQTNHNVPSTNKQPYHQPTNQPHP